MEIKLFGKQLFSFNTSKSQQLIGIAQTSNKASRYLPDFYKGFEFNTGFISIAELTTPKTTSLPKEPEKPKSNVTPKEVFMLKTLHEQGFRIKTEPAYIDEQIAAFTDKLALIKSEEYDMQRGVIEIGSILVRFENRKKYPEYQNFYDEYPYTMTTKIEELMKNHEHLKIGQVAQFLADMPKEASDTMKEYSKTTEKMCGKLPVYYIIAEKKDFEKTVKRRDPILLAQSPFGHFWQILGAWDKEMLLVEEL